MILTVEKTLGRLREIFYENPTLCGSNNIENNFYAEKKFLKCWQHYGQYNENRIIIKNTQTNDKIILNGIEFNPVVKDIHFFLISRDNNDKHTITIEGRDKDGRIFEKSLEYKASETLPYIIYAFIIMSYTKDMNEAMIFWKLLTNYYPNPTKDMNIGENLDLISKLRDFGKKIILEYPFMEAFIQDGLNKQIQEFKCRISDLDLLK